MAATNLGTNLAKMQLRRSLRAALIKREAKGAFFWAYSAIGIVGLSQIIVHSRATLIPEWLQNLHSDTVNWFWHVCNQLRPEKEGLFWSFQLFLFRNSPPKTRPKLQLLVKLGISRTRVSLQKWTYFGYHKYVIGCHVCCSCCSCRVSCSRCCSIKMFL